MSRRLLLKIRDQFNHLIKNDAGPFDNVDAWIEKVESTKSILKSNLDKKVLSRFYQIDLDMFQNDDGGQMFFTGLAPSSAKKLLSLIDDEILFLEKNKNSPEFMKKKKLLRARRESPDFEHELAMFISGDNSKFPYRSSYYLTRFFQDNGFQYLHDGSTRVYWVASVLRELNIHDIYKLVESLFKRKYFVDYGKEKQLDLEAFIDDARLEFSNFLENSIKSNELINLDSAFRLNVNFGLLSNKTAKTEDTDFNEMLTKARNFFIEGKKQEAIEKIWDAFERLKTIINPADKKMSSNLLTKALSSEIDQSFFEEEMKALTKIGNEYMIRHSEVNKKPIKDSISRDYLFFRMLSLVNLSVSALDRLKK